VTKGIAAGAALLAPFGALLGLRGFARDWLPELAALVFTLATTYLLVDDLARPRLFLTLLTRPNTRSWLVKGAWILIAFSITVPLTLAARWLGMTEVADALRWVNAALGLGVAGYTAFLFRQCEGRDLWQSPLLLPHLLVQAVLCGAALYLPFAPPSADRSIAAVFVAALTAHLAFAAAERRKRHATENGRQAAAFLETARVGPLHRPWRLATRVGILVPTLAVVLATRASSTPELVSCAVASLVALAGLYLYEAVFVRAGQLPPLS
jgi:formate-dependent nitrite reductase membrane component NrfD